MLGSNFSNYTGNAFLYNTCLSAFHPYNNQEECEERTVWRLITLQDFNHNYNNPFFMTYTTWLNYTNSTSINNPNLTTYSMIFFAICYAYSLFRLVIDWAIIAYAIKKINILLSEKETKERIREYPHLAYEIKVYKWVIYLGVLFEFMMSLHNFVVWRGLQYYTSYQDSNFNIEQKPPRICNCMYNPLLYNMKSSDASDEINYPKSAWLIAMYVIWIVFEFLGMIVIYFSVLTLSRINRKGKLGRELVGGTIKKSIILGLGYTLLLFLLIFEFDLPVFYKFYNVQVLSFWFFWKILGFLLLLDRLHSKYWLFQNLKIQSLYTHKSQWTKKLNEIRENILHEDLENLVNKMESVLEVQSDINAKEVEAIKEMLKENQDEIKELFRNSIIDFYGKVQKSIIQSNEKEKKSKLKTNWADYLNYFLGLNLLGLIGYFFLILDASNPEPLEANAIPRTCYFIGIIFCYLEIVIYDLTHGIFLLHCFFIELFKFLRRYPQFNESRVMLNSDENSDSMN